MKKALLDENLDRRLKNYFSNALDVTSVPDLGWQSKKNGELLSAMVESKFDVLLTADRNLRFQQNLPEVNILVVILISNDNRLRSIIGSIDLIESEINNYATSERYLEIDIRRK